MAGIRMEKVEKNVGGQSVRKKGGKVHTMGGIE
jgi:hypothetical protein